MQDCRCRCFARLRPELRFCPDEHTPRSQGAAACVPVAPSAYEQKLRLASTSPDAEWASISAPACRSLRFAAPRSAVSGRVTVVAPSLATEALRAWPAHTCAACCHNLQDPACIYRVGGSATQQAWASCVMANIGHARNVYVSTPRFLADTHTDVSAVRTSTGAKSDLKPFGQLVIGPRQAVASCPQQVHTSLAASSMMSLQQSGAQVHHARCCLPTCAVCLFELRARLIKQQSCPMEPFH